MSAVVALAGKKKDIYLGLVARHPLVSIKTDAQLAAACKIVDDLLRKKKLNLG